MTKLESQAVKRFAKDGLKCAGVDVKMKDMLILEKNFSSSGRFDYAGTKAIAIDYAVVEDLKSGQIYQILYGSLYNHTTCPFQVLLRPQMEWLKCFNKKYFVLYERKNGDSFGGDEPFDDINVAIASAERFWNHLTRNERINCNLCVAYGNVVDGVLDVMTGYDTIVEYNA